MAVVSRPGNYGLRSIATSISGGHWVSDGSGRDSYIHRDAGLLNGRATPKLDPIAGYRSHSSAAAPRRTLQLRKPAAAASAACRGSGGRRGEATATPLRPHTLRNWELAASAPDLLLRSGGAAGSSGTPVLRPSRPKAAAPSPQPRLLEPAESAVDQYRWFSEASTAARFARSKAQGPLGSSFTAAIEADKDNVGQFTSLTMVSGKRPAF